MTTSLRSSSPRYAAASPASPRISATSCIRRTSRRGWAGFRTSPVTACPAAVSRSAAWKPAYPDTPVTKTLIASARRGRGLLLGAVGMNERGHHLRCEQLDRFRALGRRHVAEHELSDQVVRADCLELDGERLRDRARRAGEGEAVRGHFLEARRPDLHGLLAVTPEQLEEARMPDWIGTRRQLLRLAIGLADDDEATDSHAPARPAAACRGLVEAPADLGGGGGLRQGDPMEAPLAVMLGAFRRADAVP